MANAKTDRDAGYYQELYAAGVRSISFGFETMNRALLRRLGMKPTGARFGRQSIEAAHAAGINIKGFFMVGMPHEQRQSVLKDAEFIREGLIDEFGVAYAMPLPGTAWALHNSGLYLRSDIANGPLEDRYAAMAYEEPYPVRSKAPFLPPTYTDEMSSEEIAEAAGWLHEAFEHRIK
jgi:radical SAM superfamily enzyme YgiQ (UPF0313 family)